MAGSIFQAAGGVGGFAAASAATAFPAHHHYAAIQQGIPAAAAAAYNIYATAGFDYYIYYIYIYDISIFTIHLNSPLIIIDHRSSTETTIIVYMSCMLANGCCTFNIIYIYRYVLTVSACTKLHVLPVLATHHACTLPIHHPTSLAH